MVEPFMGEIKLSGYTFPPKGWAYCDGQLMAINQNQALFSLLGTTYGGDGRTTFGLPDLRGRVAVHFDPTFPIGGTGGEFEHTLVQAELPAPHNHVAQGTNTVATTNIGQAAVFANAGLNTYAAPNPLQPVQPLTINAVGGLAHPNMAPYQVVTACIALQGIFPSRN